MQYQSKSTAGRGNLTGVQSPSGAGAQQVRERAMSSMVRAQRMRGRVENDAIKKGLGNLPLKGHSKDSLRKEADGESRAEKDII